MASAIFLFCQRSTTTKILCVCTPYLRQYEQYSQCPQFSKNTDPTDSPCPAAWQTKHPSTNPLVRNDRSRGALDQSKKLAKLLFRFPGCGARIHLLSPVVRLQYRKTPFGAGRQRRAGRHGQDVDALHQDKGFKCSFSVCSFCLRLAFVNNISCLGTLFCACLSLYLTLRFTSTK